MKMSSFLYLCRQGWHNMVANRLMSLASIGVLSACLVITGIACLLSANVNNFVSYLSAQNSVEVFIDKTAGENETNALENALTGINNISKIEYISKEQALEEMINRMGEYEDLLEEYRGEDNASNPLSASFRVTIEDISLLEKTVAEIQKSSNYIETIESPTSLGVVLTNMQKGVSFGGWALVAILGMVSIVVINNTIRLTVFARRKEINIMKYVGATNTFIRMPFFVEGMTVGAISGVLGTGIVSLMYFGVLKLLEQPTLAWMEEVSMCLYSVSEVIVPLLIGFVTFGIFIGGVGCASSIRKHLKV